MRWAATRRRPLRLRMLLRLTQQSVDEGAAILADVTTIPDHALVAFADGGFEIMNRVDLGLGPEDPVVVGEESKSPVLRALSDR